MRAKRLSTWIPFFALLGGAVLQSGCGLLGSKNDPSPTLNVPFGGSGCLNDSGLKIQAYFDGTVDPAAWTQTFNCTLQSLALLQQYSSVTEYTPDDVLALAKAFLVTNVEVPLGLVQAAFEVKASILGGSKDVLTAEELTEFSQALTLIRDESSGLIPLLHFRKTAPTTAHMLELSQGLGAATGKVGAFFAGKGSIPLSQSAMVTIAHDITKVLNLNLPSGLVDELLAGKVVLFSGAPDQIEQEIWPDAFKAAGAVAGAFIAYASVTDFDPSIPDDKGEFYYQLGVEAHGILADAVDRHGGAIALGDVDRLIDTLPASLLPVAFPTVTHAGIESALPVLFGRLFPSSQSGAVDSGSLDAILGLADQWRRGQTDLETIFAQSGLNPLAVPTAQFEAAAGRFQASLDGTERADVDRLVDLAERYEPLFYGDDNEMLFSPGVEHSRSGLERLHWVDLLSDLILSSYASNGSGLSFDDFSGLIDDIRPIGAEIGAIDPDVELFAERRFREVNMFTLASDGDDELEKDEIVSYLQIIVSLSATTVRLKADVQPVCGQGGQLDGMLWQWMDPGCFRKFYFRNVDRYWDHAPQLLEEWHGLSAAEKSELEVAIEKAARYQGYGNQALGGYDATGFLLFMILQETLFLRFDVDRDGYLDTAETLAASVPNREFIAKQANLDPNQEKILGIPEDDILDGIFTFIMAKGKVPKMDLSGYAELVIWLLSRPDWKIHAGRANTYRNAYTFADFSRFPP